MWVLFLRIPIKFFESVVYDRHFETDYYIVLKLCRHVINSGTAHFRIELYEDIFLQ